MHYRKFCSAVFTSEEEYLAYLSYRLPATYAVCEHVLYKLKHNFPSLAIHSLLDIGSGPGTGLFACKEVFPSLLQATLIERERSWIDISKKLSSGMTCQITWQQKDIEKEGLFSPHDLILLSYSLGEVGGSTLRRIEELWQATNGAFVLIEPGTPKGFSSIWAVREKLIAWGAHIVAPCPHGGACPMRGQDWCHFFTRVQRTSIHRHVKGGSLGFEDEKFSYLIATKSPSETSLESGRIIRPLLRKSGHVVATLCSKDGIITNSISKKKKELYNKVKKMEWGDGF